MFLVMMNPGEADALVEARYLLPSGEQIAAEPTRSHSTAACVCTSIKRIRASRDTRVAVTLTLTNGAGIVAELGDVLRPGATAAEWDEASASLGLTSAGTGGRLPQAKSAVRVTRGPISRWRTCLRRLPQSRSLCSSRTAEQTEVLSRRRDDEVHGSMSAVSFHPRPTSDSRRSSKASMTIAPR